MILILLILLIIFLFLIYYALCRPSSNPSIKAPINCKTGANNPRRIPTTINTVIIVFVFLAESN